MPRTKESGEWNHLPNCDWQRHREPCNCPSATVEQRRVWALNRVLCDRRLLDDPRTVADLYAAEDYPE